MYVLMYVCVYDCMYKLINWLCEREHLRKSKENI